MLKYAIKREAESSFKRREVRGLQLGVNRKVEDLSLL